MMDKNKRFTSISSNFGTLSCVGTLAAAISLASTGANAQLLHNLTIGNAKALALGNAVTADPVGIDSIHFNPAGLSKVKGRQLNVKVIAAQVNLDGSLGEPTQPGDDSLASYYRLNYDPAGDECNGTDPGDRNNPNPVPRSELVACWGPDPLANESFSASGPGLMLPFVGFTEIPVLAFPAGGVAFEDPARGWTFGTAVYTPQGIGYTRDLDDVGRFQGTAIGITRLTYFSPTIAIPVNDKLSFGVGVNFSYQGLGLETMIRAPLETTNFLNQLEDIGAAIGLDDLYILRPYDEVGLLNIEAEDLFSVGFNFGILYEPNDWLSFGFVYQSETTSELKGDYSMKNTESFLHTAEGIHSLGLDLVGTIFDGARFNVQDVETGTVELEYILPQSFAFGTSIKVLPNLKINIDLKWIEYSVWDELEFNFSNNIDFLSLSSIIYGLAPNLKDNADADAMRFRREYDDVLSFAIGGEYQWNDNIVLRAGYEPRKSSIPESSADILFPIGEADLYTVGFGLQLDSKSRVDGAFGYLTSDQDIAACASGNSNTCNEGDVVYNPYYSMPFKTETEAFIFTLSYDKKF